MSCKWPSDPTMITSLTDFDDLITNLSHRLIHVRQEIGSGVTVKPECKNIKPIQHKLPLSSYASRYVNEHASINDTI